MRHSWMTLADSASFERQLFSIPSARKKKLQFLLSFGSEACLRGAFGDGPKRHETHTHENKKGHVGFLGFGVWGLLLAATGRVIQ